MAEEKEKIGEKRLSSGDSKSIISEKKSKLQFNLMSKRSDDSKTTVQQTNAKSEIKISLGGNNTSKKPVVAPIKMSLGGVKKPSETSQIKKAGHKVASVFNADEDSEEEEMPAEAKMKMRNIGRNTPTASGPNSFGKGSTGFIDRRALLKKELEEQWNKTIEEEDKVLKTK